MSEYRADVTVLEKPFGSCSFADVLLSAHTKQYESTQAMFRVGEAELIFGGGDVLARRFAMLKGFDGFVVLFLGHDVLYLTISADGHRCFGARIFGYKIGKTWLMISCLPFFSWVWKCRFLSFGEPCVPAYMSLGS